MALDLTESELYGPVAVAIGGADVGHTDEEGVKVTRAVTIVEAMTGKHGQTPVKKWMNGERVTIEFNLLQTNFANIELAWPGATKVTDGGFSKITFGKIAGSPIVPTTLKLTSHIAAMTAGRDFTFAQAVPIGDFEIVYSGEAHNKIQCKFEALVDEAGGADGSYVGTFGDVTIAADAVVPTVTAVLPLDDAAGVAIGSAVAWTMSENLNLNTVNAFSVYLMEDAEGAGLGDKVAGVVTAVNAGAGTTITFTPDADMTPGANHTAILTDAIEDLAGNHLVMYISNFAT